MDLRAFISVQPGALMKHIIAEGALHRFLNSFTGLPLSSYQRQNLATQFRAGPGNDSIAFAASPDLGENGAGGITLEGFPAEPIGSRLGPRPPAALNHPTTPPIPSHRLQKELENNSDLSGKGHALSTYTGEAKATEAPFAKPFETI
jgi:hypothetical protein